jgi:RNA recognition motif-containing protein
VGNLPFHTTEQQVRELFARHGAVTSVTMVTDGQTGQFRGFCFVEMQGAKADAAIAALNGRSIGGRKLRVNEAQPRPKREGNRQRKRLPRRDAGSPDFSVRGGMQQGGSDRGENYRARDDLLHNGNSREEWRVRDAFQHEGQKSQASGEIYRVRDEMLRNEDNTLTNDKPARQGKTKGKGKGGSNQRKQSGNGGRRR